MKVILSLALMLILVGCSGSNSRGYSLLENQDASGLSDPVYITRYGYRYHKAKCYTIKYHEVKVVEKDEAISIGRTQCHVCRP